VYENSELKISNSTLPSSVLCLVIFFVWIFVESGKRRCPGCSGIGRVPISWNQKFGFGRIRLVAEFRLLFDGRHRVGCIVRTVVGRVRSRSFVHPPFFRPVLRISNIEWDISDQSKIENDFV
jgi:hypothetical protein